MVEPMNRQQRRQAAKAAKRQGQASQDPRMALARQADPDFMAQVINRALQEPPPPDAPGAADLGDHIRLKNPRFQVRNGKGEDLVIFLTTALSTTAAGVRANVLADPANMMKFASTMRVGWQPRKVSLTL